MTLTSFIKGVLTAVAVIFFAAVVFGMIPQ